MILTGDSRSTERCWDDTDRGQQNFGEKRFPVSLRSQPSPHELPWDRIRVSEETELPLMAKLRAVLKTSSDCLQIQYKWFAFVTCHLLLLRITDGGKYSESISDCTTIRSGPRQLSRYSHSLRAELSRDRFPVWARFFAPFPTGPGAHPASDIMVPSLSRE
jgi:hypothetical protein